MKFKILLLSFLTSCILLPVFGQKSETGGNKKFSVSGVITDRNNKPVSGATIFIDSVLTKYTTDEQGRYRLKVNPTAKKIS
jgi:protocatechuate 3,4-dioxygenase beta subunit